MNNIKLTIVGSRFYNDYTTIENHILTWIKEHNTPVEIVSDGATGIDTVSRKICTKI